MKPEQINLPLHRRHTIECFACNDRGWPIYTPNRADGLDRNLRFLRPIDFRPNMRGLTLVCSLGETDPLPKGI